MNDLDAQPIELSAVEEKRYISVVLISAITEKLKLF